MQPIHIKIASVHTHFFRSRGISFIDVIVGSALMIIIFLGIFAAFKLSLALNTSVRARTGALSLANERMEYMRSLPYASLGTSGGIPAGALVQNESITLNVIRYNRRTLIQYADDPGDGLGAADTNGITADYKVLKVEVTWNERGIERSYSLSGRISPKAIESTTGGGTLAVHITNAAGEPLGSARVGIINSTISPAVDTAAFSNDNGDVSFPGAPAGGGYQITVTKPWYSSAQTYGPSVGNPNPSPSHISVATSSTSLITFALDHLAGLVLKSYSPPEIATTTETFLSEAGLEGLSFATLSGGDLLIAFEGSGYPEDAEATVSPRAPERLLSWKQFTAIETLPAHTSIRYHFVSGTPGAPVLIPDSALPGNSAGFTGPTVDLSGLSVSLYSALGVTISLHSDDLMATPRVSEGAFSFEQGPNPLPNVSFSLHGEKIIGEGPVYKTAFSTTTNGAGVREIYPLEWDTYSISSGSGYNIADACTAEPFKVLPGATTTLSFILVPKSAHTLRVIVRDNTGAPVPNAQVTLSAPSKTTLYGTTSSCGQTFFPNITATTYSILAQKAGYADTLDDNAAVSGQTVRTLTLTP